ncbi:Uncharacterised protein [Bordetella pertussis]|nr:Uncharacterised protein [Bordetella pertussis]
MAGDMEEALPLLIGEDTDAHISVLGAVRLSLRTHQSGVAPIVQGWNKGVAIQMVAEHEVRERFEHRHFHGLTMPIAFSPI